MFTNIKAKRGRKWRLPKLLKVAGMRSSKVYKYLHDLQGSRYRGMSAARTKDQLDLQMARLYLEQLVITGVAIEEVREANSCSEASSKNEQEAQQQEVKVEEMNDALSLDSDSVSDGSDSDQQQAEEPLPERAPPIVINLAVHRPEDKQLQEPAGAEQG